MPFMNGMACVLEGLSRFAWNILGSHLVGVWNGAPTLSDIVAVSLFGVIAWGWAASLPPSRTWCAHCRRSSVSLPAFESASIRGFEIPDLLRLVSHKVLGRDVDRLPAHRAGCVPVAAVPAAHRLKKVMSHRIRDVVRRA
jgi:hypothetical protein